MFYGNYDYCSSCYRIRSSDRKQRFTLQIRRMKSQKFRNTQCNTALEYHRDGREKRLLFRNNITRMGCTRSDSGTPFYFAVHSLVTYHLRHIVTPSFLFPLSPLSQLPMSCSKVSSTATPAIPIAFIHQKITVARTNIEVG